MTSKSLWAIACAVAASPAAWADGPHWSYQGSNAPGHWAELDASFKTCKLGRAQSPINIDTTQVETSAAAKPIVFAYAASAAEVVNNGHTIQVNVPAGGGVSIEGATYKLLQFHFHTPSEETIDGRPAPLVAHLVHRDAQGRLAVVAVLFRPGKENGMLKPVFEQLPAQEGKIRTLEGTLNLDGLLPADRRYFRFMGSLTTPPCSEDVLWNVLATPVEISEGQLAAFKKLFEMNARPVQALNGRKVFLGP